MDEFRTVRGYQLLRRKGEALSPSMEDYLEMIYRLCRTDDFTRVHSLAELLNVQAPSVSRVLRKLRDRGYVKFSSYGVIQLTDLGRTMGQCLLERHRTVEEFLRTIGVTENLLADTELIEHHMSGETLNCLSLLNDFLRNNPQILALLTSYRREQGG